ncbi:MAG: hypothetical protein WC028_20075 [Candidatus Obscuribacterales bacterium]
MQNNPSMSYNLSSAIFFLLLVLHGFVVPAYAKPSTDVSIQLCEFSRLKPKFDDFSGAVGIRFENSGRHTTIVPFSWIPTPHLKNGKSAWIVSPEKEMWGVSSRVKYSWIDKEGNKILEGESPMDKEWLTLKKNSSEMRSVLIKIPDKPGQYKFNLCFDNTIIDVRGSEFTYYFPEKYATFKSDIEEIVIVE